MTYGIGVFNGKGGVKKSTTSRAVAVAFRKAEWDTVCIDMDIRNATTTRWGQRRMANNIEPSIPIQMCGTATQVQKIIDSGVYDLAVVDGGAYASDSVPRIAAFLDMIIIPTGFSIDDLETTVDTANSLVQKGIPVSKICLAFAGAVESESDYTEAREYLSKTPFFLVDNYIPLKPSLSKAQDKGQSVIECSYVEPRKKADEVIQGIIDRFESLIAA